MAATKAKAAPKKKATAPKVEVTVARFDTSEPYRTVRDAVPLGKFGKLTHGSEDYFARGGTPLLDATMSFVAQLKEKRSKKRVTVGVLLDASGSMGGNEAAVVDGVNEFVGGMASVAADPEAAGKVFAVIVTDGHENSSRECSKADVAAAVKELETDGWTFIFMGANQDAWGEARALGYSGGATGQSVNFVATPKGIGAAMADATSHAVGYLGDNASYPAYARLRGTNRTVGEDGAPKSTPKPKPTPTPTPTPEPRNPFADAGEALRKAQEGAGR